MYKYHACAKIGNICFIWKVLEKKDQVRQYKRSRKTTPNVPNTIRSKVFTQKIRIYCNSILNTLV